MNTSGPTEKRKGLRRLAAAAEAPTRALFKKQGFARREILTRWTEIVGPLLAKHSQPENITYAVGRNGEGTLHLRVAGAFALEFQHLEPLIVERVNAYYGYRAVARLSLTQAPLPRPEQSSRPAPRQLSETERQALTKEIQGTRDPELRAALERLGEAVWRAGGSDI